MISFIVIGMNESKNLKRCFDSIQSSINRLEKKHKTEVIFVDSDSIDNSVEIAQNHKTVNKIFRISGEINSAIARNVGVEYSKGDILFLIDGDMEIYPTFTEKIFRNKTHRLFYPFITGELVDINIRSNKKDLRNKKILNKSYYSFITGGIFIIERRLWIKNNGMDIRFKRGQDRDFSFSLSLKGIKVLRINSIICNHYHNPYHQRERFFETVIGGYEKYTGLFIRKYLLRSFYTWYFMIRKEYTAIILFALILFTIFFKIGGLMLIYLILIIIRTILHKHKFSILSPIHRIINDFIFLVSIFFFYPSKDKIYNTEIVK